MWADVQIIKVVNGKLGEILQVPEEAGEGEGYCGYFILRAAVFAELPAIFLNKDLSILLFHLYKNSLENQIGGRRTKAHHLYIFAPLPTY